MYGRSMGRSAWAWDLGVVVGRKTRGGGEKEKVRVRASDGGTHRGGGHGYMVLGDAIEEEGGEEEMEGSTNARYRDWTRPGKDWTWTGLDWD
ncbi:hypothetical protein CMUS01_08190 [Colletotrichum musicola]|uniref:Uncharacterized protein n=1 Tax=Colletotrichum musicola TaxID=2175873 RepID=A0A8H6KDC4_9PEZI|nr:hypothetical protein CMUS01_08190 [Colletotrichum musicola]